MFSHFSLPQTCIRTDHGLINHGSMLAAIKEVVDELKPVRAVAKRRGISKSTLCLRVAQYKDDINANLGSIFNKSQISSTHQEKNPC